MSLTSLSKGKNGEICQARKPFPYFTIVYASYCVGHQSTSTKNLHHYLTRYIHTEADCATQGVNDPTDCIAYLLFGQLSKFIPYEPTNEFFSTLPAYESKYKDMVIKISKLRFDFENEIRDIELDWTVCYTEICSPKVGTPENDLIKKESPKPAPVVKDTSAQAKAAGEKYEKLLRLRVDGISQEDSEEQKEEEKSEDEDDDVASDEAASDKVTNDNKIED